MENFFFKNPSHFGDMFGLFEEFYRSNSMADVVIAVDGKTIKAHRIVLSAGSDYFRRILVSVNSTSHVPILFITDISYEDMESIIEFIYRGQILVTRDKVESLRQAAYKLRIKGFENFLRKPFNSSGIGMGNNHHHQSAQQQIKYNPSSSIPRNLSMLNQEHQQQQQSHKRSMQTSENENKRIRGNNAGMDASRTREALLQLHRQRQQIVPNANGYPDSRAFNNSTPKEMQRKQIENFMKRASHEGSPRIDMSQLKFKPDPDASTVSRAHSDNGEHHDENEDNQRNENTENSFTEKAQDLSKDASKRSRGHANRSKEEADSDQEVNYTYEMDPNSLGCWDTYNDENVPENPEGDSDGYDEEEDYFENDNVSSESHKLEMLLSQANMAKMNASFNPQAGFFYCEHCPKYFFDEDQLHVHIKRSHGLNKLNQCNICGKTYAWKSGLYKHKRHVHGITGKTLNPVNDNGMDSQSPSPPTTPTGPVVSMGQSILPPPVAPPQMALPTLASHAALQSAMPGMSLIASLIEQPAGIKA